MIAALYSCNKDGNNFTVKYSNGSTGQDQLFLARQTLTGPVAVDSAMPDRSGSYSLKGHTDIPGFFILYFQPSQFINLIIHPGDNITVTGTNSTFDYQYFVEGSKDSRLVQQLVTQQAQTLRQITELSTEYENSIGTPDFETVKQRIDSTYDEIVASHKQYSIQIIKENPGSLAGLMALYQQLGRSTTVFDYKSDFRVYEMVDSSLSSKYPNSEAVQELDGKVAEIRDMLRTDTGAIAPEITLPDTSGTKIAMSSLRGNYVVLYFWASWSPGSVTENEALSPIYHMYSGKGLKYYQVSLDRTRESWIKALKEFNPAGIQVNDLSYWDSPVVESYLIEDLPVIYLLDQQGRIIDKGCTPDELNDTLKVLMNK